MQEFRVRSLGVEDPLEKEMATHSSILVWRISWTEEPGGLQSMGLQTVGHDWATNTYGGFWMISYQLMFPLWCSQVLGLSRLPLGFSFILTMASRLLHPYSRDNKTSRLMVKRFSTVRDTRRGSQSYMEKRRGRREIKVTRRRKGAIKTG